MICLSVTSTSCAENIKLVKHDLSRIQCVELRADYLVSDEHAAVAKFPSNVKQLDRSLITVLTMRKVADGGQCTLSDSERLTLLFNILRASISHTLFDFVDIEFANRVHPTAQRIMQWCHQNGVGIICSLHRMTGGVSHLYRYIKMIARVGQVVPKVAVHIAGSKDQWLFYRQLLLFHRRFSDIQLIAIGMGHAGTITRILARKFGCLWTYATASPMDEATTVGTTTTDSTSSNSSADNNTATNATTNNRTTTNQTILPSEGNSDRATDTSASLKSLGVLSAEELNNRYRYNTHNNATSLFAVIGNPVAHSKSPQIHNRWFSEDGHNACYLPLYTDSVRHFFKLAHIIKLAGASVTTPHKQTVIRYLASRTDSVRRIKSCNTVIWRRNVPNTTVHHHQTPYPSNSRHRSSTTPTDQHGTPAANHPNQPLINHSMSRSKPSSPPRNIANTTSLRKPHGDNTDKQGFLAGLDTLIDTTSTPHHINIIGAGGVALTVAVALLERKCPITVANRSPKRARSLLRILGAIFPQAVMNTVPLTPQQYPTLRSFASVFINTTSVGMAHASNHSPLPNFQFAASDIVYDLIYTPPVTPLLKDATAQGAQTLNGQLMFDQQAMLQYHQFCTVLS